MIGPHDRIGADVDAVALHAEALEHAQQHAGIATDVQELHVGTEVDAGAQH